MTTITDICILENNNELWCGEGKSSDADRFVAPLKPEMGKVEDVIDGINSSKYPWNYNYYEGVVKNNKIVGKRVLQKVDKDRFNFQEKAGLPIEYIKVNDLIEYMYNGLVFIDLAHHKIMHFDHQSPMGAFFPKEQIGVYKSRYDPYAMRKQDKCIAESKLLESDKSEIIREIDCHDKAFYAKKKTPKGFTPVIIPLDERMDKSINTEQAIQDLIDKVAVCKPAGEFFRSLSECL